MPAPPPTHGDKRAPPRVEPGSTAIVIDHAASRHHCARALGAETCFEELSARTIEAMRDLTRCFGVEAVLDSVGNDQSIETGLALTR